MGATSMLLPSGAIQIASGPVSRSPERDTVERPGAKHQRRDSADGTADDARAMAVTVRRIRHQDAPHRAKGTQAPARELRRSAGLGGIEGAEPLASPQCYTWGMLALTM